MVRDNRHVIARLFGAICPQRAMGAGFITPYVDARAMNEHLDEIGIHVVEAALTVQTKAHPNRHAAFNLKAAWRKCA
jgi:hypothetical protein